jgi:hypothetical protein
MKWLYPTIRVMGTIIHPEIPQPYRDLKLNAQNRKLPSLGVAKKNEIQ